jgi:hypothetical protein
MKARFGTFQQFKEHTLAIAQGKRQSNPHESKIWIEQRTRKLEDYSIGDLEDTRRRIEETEEWVSERAEALPGPGWEHLKERLQRDRAAVEAELSRRYPPE